MTKITVSAIQVSNVTNDKEAMLNKVFQYVEEAAEKGAKIISLGELFQTEYFCSIKNDDTFALAETIPGPTTNKLAEIAKELGVAIIGSLFEEDNGKYYNTAVLVGPDGEHVGIYRKTHIPNVHYGNVNTNEDYYFLPGDKGFPVFDVFGVKVGILICFDRSFPEAWRELKLAGAEVVFVPTASSGWRGELWETELIVRAAENNLFVVAPNRGGYQGKLSFFGKSVIINPFGDILHMAGKDEEVAIVEQLDLSEIKVAETKSPYMKFRRPEIYVKIAEAK